jgi:hypothetical protein
MRPALLLAALVSVGCRRDAERRAPPPPAPAAVADCTRGPGVVTDEVSAAFLPRTVGASCLDPTTPVRAYGRDAKRPLDEVCTEVFDGECEAYKALGLERVVTLRYLDPTTKGAAANVILSRFPSPEIALAFLGRRAVGDAEPEERRARPFEAGTAAIANTGAAYVARGAYVAELVYLDDAATVDSLAAATERVLVPIAKALGAALPGDVAVPPAYARLPKAHLAPGTAIYATADLLGLGRLGAGAAGHYRDGTRRYRLGLALASDEAGAERLIDALRAPPFVAPPAPLPKAPFGAFSVVAADHGARGRDVWLVGRAGRAVAVVVHRARPDGPAALDDVAGLAALEAALAPKEKTP